MCSNDLSSLSLNNLKSSLFLMISGLMGKYNRSMSRATAKPSGQGRVGGAYSFVVMKILGFFFYNTKIKLKNEVVLSMKLRSMLVLWEQINKHQPL